MDTGYDLRWTEVLYGNYTSQNGEQGCRHNSCERHREPHKHRRSDVMDRHDASTNTEERRGKSGTQNKKK